MAKDVVAKTVMAENALAKCRMANHQAAVEHRSLYCKKVNVLKLPNMRRNVP